MLSIIFLHWVEDKGPLRETLLSLESIFRYTTIPYELIIVSNGSTEECNIEIRKLVMECNASTYASKVADMWAKSYNLPTELKYIYLENNKGVSKGFNAGLKEISDDSKYISIFSNDWFITNNTFENMIKALDLYPELGFATACTNWGTGSMCFDRNNPVMFQKPVLNIHADDFFKANEIFGDHQELAGDTVTFNPFPAMGWTMKREVFDDVGLMDERIFCANDLAYGIRARLYGWGSGTVWNSWIYHEWHSSFSQINDKETYSYLKPKDQADIKLIQTDKYYKVK